MMNIRELSTSEIMQVDGAGPIKDSETGSVIGTVIGLCRRRYRGGCIPIRPFWRCYRVFLGVRLGDWEIHWSEIDGFSNHPIAYVSRF